MQEYYELLSKTGYTFENCDVCGYGSSKLVSLSFGLTDLEEYVSRKCRRVSAILDKSHSVHLNSSLIDPRVRGSITSGLKQFRILEGQNEKTQLFAELWIGDKQITKSKLLNCKEVYFDGLFGSPKFITNDLVAFIGEAAEPRYPQGPFQKLEDNMGTATQKFELTPDYGETLVKTRKPVLFVFDVLQNTCQPIRLPLPPDPKIKNIHPAFVAPLPDGALLFTGYHVNSSLHNPGLSRCFNRASCIYKVSDYVTDTVRMDCITEGVYLALAPIVSPDGTKCVFAGHKESFSPHCTELDLFLLDLTKAGSTPICFKVEGSQRADDSVIPTWNGLNLTSQSESALISFLPDNKTIVVPSFSSAKGGIFLIDTETRRVLNSVFPPNESKLSSCILLKVEGYDLVFTHSGYLSPRSVWLAEVSPADFSDVTYTKIFETPLIDVHRFRGFLNASLSVIQTENCPAWLIRSGLDTRDTRRPLIAYLHGGPHMMAVSGFSVEIAAFLTKGYDIVIPNYRGSLSFGKEFLHALVGNAGIMDVADCHACVEHAKELLKPSSIIAYGGSHGGFLTGWLLGNPVTRATYSCGVLWNPAVDLVSSNLTSDIPEWSLAAALEDSTEKETPFAPSIKFLNKAYNQSAISVVKNVTVPALVVLGSNDKRVVPCAGLRWAQAVEENGGDVKVLWFPDQGHAITAPESNVTALVSIHDWIDSHK